jgi:predicted AAA+ superfamily ATPase
MIKRSLENIIIDELFKGKAIIVFGPRQSGKTTLIKSIVSNLKYPHKWLNADEADVRRLFIDATSTGLRAIIGDKKILVIDEAQRISNIGLAIKLLVDNYPEIQIIATGSSSFELSNKIKEPLTGRKFEHFLLPFSFVELVDNYGFLEEKRLLERRLIFGSYPEIVKFPDNEIKNLSLLSDSYLYKDILAWQNINKPHKLEVLLKGIALQLGSEVSYNELAQLTGLNIRTVENYIDILEKAFIVFRLSALFRNKRNELKKSKKIYFFDNGIRNAIINNFNMPDVRNDIGALWENYLMSERIKYTNYNDIFLNRYFWRTRTRQEIDYVEEREGKLFAFEFKWNPKMKYRFPKTFLENYPDNETRIVNKENYEDFLGIKM